MSLVIVEETVFVRAQGNTVVSHFVVQRADLIVGPRRSLIYACVWGFCVCWKLSAAEQIKSDCCRSACCGLHFYWLRCLGHCPSMLHRSITQTQVTCHCCRPCHRRLGVIVAVACHSCHTQERQCWCYRHSVMKISLDQWPYTYLLNPVSSL